MRKKIGKTAYDTEKATHLGCKFAGEYGDPGGYEERLFVTDKGNHFLYGIGGIESQYIEPKIIPLDETQAELWQIENGLT